MDSAVEKALARLKELQKEQEEISQFLAVYERLTGTKIEQSEPKVEFDLRPPRRDATPREIADMVERLLRELNRPLQRGELVDLLEQRDVILPGSDKPRYLGTIMWRNKGRFANIPGEGYFLPDLMNADKREASQQLTVADSMELVADYVGALVPDHRKDAFAEMTKGHVTFNDQAGLREAFRDRFNREPSDIEMRRIRAAFFQALKQA